MTFSDNETQDSEALDQGAFVDDAASDDAVDSIEESGSTKPSSIPPANFTMLLNMFSTQAMVGLGVLSHPGTGQPEPNLDLAKHFIDLLGVVEEKTLGNLSPHEKGMLENALHDLRMLYVQKRSS